MKVYYKLEDFSKPDFAVVTSGTFDGVHIGHKKILMRIKAIASHNSGESVVLTFWPHPRLVLHKDHSNLKLLSTIEEKIKLIADSGIDHLLVIPFTEDFSKLTSDEFVRQILIETIGTKILVIGYDHRFGKNREGSFEYLKNNSQHYGFTVEEISPQDIDDVTISSTKIRKCLSEGDVSLAGIFLGRYYSISGKVVNGDKIGRSLGYPTANLKIDEPFKLIPCDGIYACTVRLKNNKTYGGMVYIGNRPTFDAMVKSIEVNIFDFDADIYTENIEINFVKLIREDMRFESTEALRERMQIDEMETKEILSKLNLI